MKKLLLLALLVVGCDNSTEPDIILYDNFYIYHGFGGIKKCHEWNDDPSSSFFENSQYSLLSDGNCIEYCTDYLNNIQSGWSNYSCYDCSISIPIPYKLDYDGNIYQDSTLSSEILSAYCQSTDYN